MRGESQYREHWSFGPARGERPHRHFLGATGVHLRTYTDLLHLRRKDYVLQGEHSRSPQPCVQPKARHYPKEDGVWILKSDKLDQLRTDTLQAFHRPAQLKHKTKPTHVSRSAL